MLFTYKENLQETLVRHLASKKQTAKDLLCAINIHDKNYTIQALYVVLRSLIKTEVIIKRGVFYFLNEEWRARVIEKLNTKIQTTLAEGEHVTYFLSSLIHHDLQWKNIVLPLHNSHPNDPVFFYNYHYIWIHLGNTRKNSELNYYASLTKEKRQTFSLIGSKNIHDIAIKKSLQNEYVRWSVGAEYFKKTDYIAVFNDYITITRMSHKLVDEIDSCYNNSATTEELERNLRKLDIDKRSIRLMVECNHEKAKKLRKKISRDFSVPQELIKKYDLY
jgi:hypothetical protein